MSATERCECGCPPKQHFDYSDDGSGCANCPTCDHYVVAANEPTAEDLFGGPR